MADLKLRLKQLLVANLYLEGIQPEDITDDMPLFEKDGLGLDSLDAVELVVILEKEFGVRIKNADAAKNAFQSITILADYLTNAQELS